MSEVEDILKKINSLSLSYSNGVLSHSEYKRMRHSLLTSLNNINDERNNINTIKQMFVKISDLIKRD